ncbi:MAG: dTDP-4-dehydrorhamnose reductase [Acidobacteriota bacterium]
MKVALIGADGQLGSEIIRENKSYEIIPLYYPKFDVTKFEEVREYFKSLRPDAVINTAAFHRVDECEDFPEKSFFVNSISVRNLAMISNELDFTLVHFSTDYVFDGEKRSPYIEEDNPNPLNVYGTSKLVGEIFLKNIGRKYFLIRTSGLYGVSGSIEKGGNFVEFMVKFAKEGRKIRVVRDQVLTPTNARELAIKILKLINTDLYGVFHMTNEGYCSWYEFAEEIFNLIKMKVYLAPVTSEEYGAKAKRPKYSVLENKNLKNTDIEGFSHWREALESYLKEKRYI